jgi:hypothetical protein
MVGGKLRPPEASATRERRTVAGMAVRYSRAVARSWGLALGAIRSNSAAASRRASSALSEPSCETAANCSLLGRDRSQPSQRSMMGGPK